MNTHLRQAPPQVHEIIPDIEFCVSQFRKHIFLLQNSGSDGASPYIAIRTESLQPVASIIVAPSEEHANLYCVELLQADDTKVSTLCDGYSHDACVKALEGVYREYVQNVERKAGKVAQARRPSPLIENDGKPVKNLKSRARNTGPRRTPLMMGCVGAGAISLLVAGAYVYQNKQMGKTQTLQAMTSLSMAARMPIGAPHIAHTVPAAATVAEPAKPTAAPVTALADSKSSPAAETASEPPPPPFPMANTSTQPPQPSKAQMQVAPDPIDNAPAQMNTQPLGEDTSATGAGDTEGADATQNDAGSAGQNVVQALETIKSYKDAHKAIPVSLFKQLPEEMQERIKPYITLEGSEQAAADRIPAVDQYGIPNTPSDNAQGTNYGNLPTPGGGNLQSSSDLKSFGLGN